MNFWTYNQSKSFVNAGPFKILGLVCHVRMNQRLNDARQTLLLPLAPYGLAAVQVEIILNSGNDENETNADANRCAPTT